MKDLELLLGKLESGECRWKKLDDTELEEHRQVLAAKRVNGDICQRKRWSDKGKKRGTYKKRSSADKENDGPDVQANSESEQHQQDHNVLQRKNPLSREILSDTDGEN